MALSVSEDAQRIDVELRDRAAWAANKFEHLIAEAEKRASEPPKKSAKAGSWSEKIEKMR